jgi:hypothetical protein
MWIVLAHSYDKSALWAFRRLRERSGHPVELVLVEALDTPGTRWVHAVGDTGARVEVQLDDGRRLDTLGIRAVLNRLTQPPAGLVAAAVPADAAYARTELTAFAASWIRALAPVVVNAPTPQGLCGRWRPPLQWRTLGLQAGLPIAPLRMASTQPDGEQDLQAASSTVLMIDGELIYDSAPPEIRAGARRFAALSETAILGLRFAGTDPAQGRWRLLDATPQPDLSAGSDAGIAALEGVLAQ